MYTGHKCVDTINGGLEDEAVANCLSWTKLLW